MGREIFISYSRKDKAVVFPYVNQISKAVGKDCWIDIKGIESGVEFEEVIIKAIDECQVVLFMLSDSSLLSKWTKREVIYAEDEGKRIVPVLVNGNRLRGWFKFHFGNVDFINIRSEEHKEKLVNNLRTWLGVEKDESKRKAEEARRKVKEEEAKETAFWKQCSPNSISQLKEYIRKYPNGMYITRAKSLIANLERIEKDAIEESRMYNQCRTRIDYMDYLRKYPNGIYKSQAQAKIKEFDKVAAQERDDGKAKAWNVLHSWCPEDVEKYGISIFSFVPGKKLTVYYRGYTFECQEEIAMIKNFLDIKRISNMIKLSEGRGFFVVKDYIRKDFETYCKESSNILANAENMITFCSESDYLRLLRMQKRRHIHIRRIAQEMQLLPLCYDPNIDSVFSIEYQNLFCDAESGGCLHDILQAGFLGGHRSNLKDLGYSVSITHKLSAFEGFTYLVLGVIVMYEILTKRYEDDTVLFSAFPFDVNAVILVNGRCRDYFSLCECEYLQTGIPMKSSKLIIDDDCSSVILSLLGKRFAFDIPKLFGYVPKSFEITFDVDANLVIIFSLKDKESNKEISIRQEELLDYEERG